MLHAAKALQDTFEGIVNLLTRLLMSADEMAVEEKKNEADADESETPMET